MGKKYKVTVENLENGRTELSTETNAVILSCEAGQEEDGYLTETTVLPGEDLAELGAVICAAARQLEQTAEAIREVAGADDE